MKKMIAATLVLGLCAIVAQAGIVISTPLAGTYTVTRTGNTTQTVDVYNIVATADTGKTTGAVNFTVGTTPVGTMTMSTMGVNPFQIATYVLGEDPDPGVYTQTASLTTGGALSTTGNMRYADTHMLLADAIIGVGIKQPTENNNYAFCTDPLNATRQFGKGSFGVIVGIDALSRTQVTTVMQVGVVRGDSVYLTGSFSDNLGADTSYSNLLIPEPATMSLLALGAIGLIRRRRA